MAKRHQALIPLTHDHHHALVQARALIAASDSDPDTRMRVAKSFTSFYGKDTLLHFHEEEEVLFPRLLEHVEEEPAVLTRVLVEHVRIHGMVAQLKHALTSGAPSGSSSGSSARHT
jgi:hypothetical protein